MSNRRTLILDAAQAASNARESVGADLVAPIDIYSVAKAMGVRVLFVAFSMEGFYSKSSPPRIMLSARRPLARRAFTCAHEVGHHWFGHGSTVDELQADDRQDSDNPNEILANAFAGFMLMPTISVRGAFNRRGWKPDTANPAQILTIASEFGVGYETLLTQLSVTLWDMQQATRTELGKWTPQRIRNKLLGSDDSTGLVILDMEQQAASVDLEVGYTLAVPTGAKVDGPVLRPRQKITDFDVYDAIGRGCATVETSKWKIEARVAPHEFVGAAQYRFLEDPDE